MCKDTAVEATEEKETQARSRLADASEEDLESEQLVAKSPLLKGDPSPSSHEECCRLQEVQSELHKLSYAPKDLFIVYAIKIAECAAYYGTSYVFAHYLTEDFGLTDQEAGNLYAAYGGLCFIVGILLGFVIDRLGVRRSMLLGCMCSTLARFIMAITTSKYVIVFTSLTVAPIGAAFGVPALALAVRRYTHVENRSMAFSIFYCALCLACIMGSIIINRVRHNYVDGVEIFGFQCSWLRLVVIWSTLLTACTPIAAYFVRDVHVFSGRPLEECAYVEKRSRVQTSIRDITKQAQFWRLSVITLFFCGVRMTFRHMDATFPKYFIRTHGPEAPFEVFVGLNPLLTMLATPLVTVLIKRHGIRLDQTLLLGAFISGISVFTLAVDESYASALLFVLVLSIGEAIWSPKLYEFSTMAAPHGREGVFVAIAFAPQYLASVPVGTLSGWALSTFCGRHAAPENRYGRTMWLIIGLTSFSSFMLLWLFRTCLFPREDSLETQDDEEAGDSDSL